MWLSCEMGSQHFEKLAMWHRPGQGRVTMCPVLAYVTSNKSRDGSMSQHVGGLGHDR